MLLLIEVACYDDVGVRLDAVNMVHEVLQERFLRLEFVGLAVVADDIDLRLLACFWVVYKDHRGHYCRRP